MNTFIPIDLLCPFVLIHVFDFHTYFFFFFFFARYKKDFLLHNDNKLSFSLSLSRARARKPTTKLD